MTAASPMHHSDLRSIPLTVILPSITTRSPVLSVPYFFPFTDNGTGKRDKSNLIGCGRECDRPEPLILPTQSLQADRAAIRAAPYAASSRCVVNDSGNPNACDTIAESNGFSRRPFPAATSRVCDWPVIFSMAE